MTDTNSQTPAEPSQDQIAEGAQPASAEAPVDALEAARRDAAELKDRLLRTLAEMENLRRRSEREVADARAYGIAGFARDILGVADNMRRALDTIDADLREKAGDGVKPLIDGIDLTERELQKAMEKHGIRRFEPKGEKFDPNLHQAMFEVPDPSVPAGTVVQVMQAGYRIGERVLRPAMVGVAKGGPKPGNAETPAAEPTSERTA
jgi:molecular chaperone GrpE